MAQFEVRAAYVLGILLPVAETLRRRTNFDDIAAYVDDYIVGAILLVAAYSVSRKRSYGRPLMVAAWGILCGGLYGSFFGQMRALDAPDVSGLSSALVAAIKGAVYVIAIIALVQSIMRLRTPQQP